MIKRYIGIDPGTTPAIAEIDLDGNIITNTLLKGSTFPHEKYRELLHSLNINDGETKVILERPHSVFGSSSKSNFNFGGAVFACYQGVVDMRVTPKEVSPKIWTKAMWQEQDIVKKGKKKDTKATSKQCAKRLSEDWNVKNFLPTNRSVVPNHNMIDAYLIAQYGRMHT